MALSFLNGSLSTIAVSLGGTAVTCGFGRWLLQIVRGATRRTTFCDTGWVQEQPGDKQGVGQLDGYGTEGTPWSDVLIWITSATVIAFVLTANTGSFLTFSGNVFSDGLEVVAAANVGRGVGFRSTGAIVSTWVTS